MRLRRVALQEHAGYSVAVWDGDRWVPLVPALEHRRSTGGTVPAELADAARDIIAFLSGGETVRQQAEEIVAWVRDQGLALSHTFDARPLLPFQPRSFRDFSLWEQHMIDAARGIVARFMPNMLGIVRAYESLTKRPFPKLRPKKMFYEVPIYYMGNHLNFYGEGDTIPWPSYTQALDYELELGVIIARPVRNASPEEARAAIGGFVVLNDFSARDMQAQEYAEGVFGPVVKAKNFANALGADVITADDILPRFESLRGTVRVNDEVWGQGTTASPTHSLADMVAYASWGENLYPGELLGTGTFPGCSGVEVGKWLRPGDQVTLDIEGVGTLTNVIGQPETAGFRHT